MKYYLVVWKDYNGFHKKRIQSYSNWYNIVNDLATNGIGNMDEVVSISLDTNPPIEE
jgi:hypothetical protein